MTSPKFAAVLFDAVGTLIVLREPVGETYARFAVGLGLRVAPDVLQAEFARQLHRRRAPVFPDAAVERRPALELAWWRELVRDVLLAAAPGAPLRGFDTVFAALYAHYGGAAAWTAAPGARQLLGDLRARGLRLAVVSNFDHRLHEVLRQLALRPLLEAVVLPGDAGAAKPDAAIFHFALRLLAVAPAAALYVGDDPEEDIAAARAAGMTALRVEPGSGLAAVRAAVVRRIPS